MKDEQGTSTAQTCGAHVASNAASVQPLYQQIKLALDVHAGDLRVVRMVDGAKPQPPQKLTIAGFLEWVASKQQESNHWWKPERWGVHLTETVVFESAIVERKNSSFVPGL